MGGQGGAEESAWGSCEGVKNLLHFVARRKIFDLHKEKQLGWGGKGLNAFFKDVVPLSARLDLLFLK